MGKIERATDWSRRSRLKCRFEHSFTSALARSSFSSFFLLLYKTRDYFRIMLFHRTQLDNSILQQIRSRAHVHLRSILGERAKSLQGIEIGQLFGMKPVNG